MAKKKISPEVLAKLDEARRELRQLIAVFRERADAQERHAG